MEFRHEMIDYGDNIPIKFFLHQLGHSGKHWHHSMELLFAVSGQVTVTIAESAWTLEPGDVILVNSNEPHELSAENAILVAVQIKLSLFEDKYLKDTTLYFDCNSRTRPNDPGLDQIKRIVAMFVKNYENKGPDQLLRARSLSYALIAELVARYKVNVNTEKRQQSQLQYERITRIVDYINAHYDENISLIGIAEQEFLSVPYLSKIFQRMMGVGFLTYLGQVRLTRAVADLHLTDWTIETIAKKNGFPSSQAFVQLFKKKYGMLPSQYRRQQPAGAHPAPPPAFNDYTVLDTHHYLNVFAQYLRDEPALPPVSQEVTMPEIVSHYTVNCASAPGALRHTWKNFVCVGSARELLLEDVQQMLRMLQRDVGYRYIKFHGILSDDMHVCARGKDGELSFSFIYVDKVLDFLLSIGLKPLVQLSFMPAALAREPARRIFDSAMINSEPSDIRQWQELIDRFVRHLIARYDHTEVESWIFTIWNEPDTPRSMFGFDSEDAFFSFYQATYRTLRAIDPRLVIASPSCYYDFSDQSPWLLRFTRRCAEADCLPDAVLFHYYGTNIASQVVKNHEGDISLSRITLSTDENLLSKSISLIRGYLLSDYPPGTPLYLTEWNFSPAHREPLGDTCFRSCYLVKNILENYDRVDGMGYWLLTDLFEEHQVPQELFHGGLGMFTYNGVKKPAYYAFWLLAKLGDALIDSGDGYFVTRKGTDYRIMLYHYQHFSDLYASGETFDMTATDRYTPFPPERRREFSLRFTEIADGAWRVTEYTLNRQSGSAFDKWVEMGAQPIETPEEVELLQSLSRPMINKYTVQAMRGMLDLHAILEPHEVRLIQMTR